MNKKPHVVSLRTQKAISQEAADWLVKMDSESFSKKDREALKSWLQQDPAHAHALKSLATVWSDMDLYVHDVALMENEQHSHSGSATETSPAFFSRTYAFPFLFVILFSFLLWQPLSEQVFGLFKEPYYATEVGSQKLNRLPDGSTVHLNTDTVIEVAYTDDKRGINLLRGEALFDVEHDPERPFVVYISGREVRAIGTKFVVRLESNNILVTVTDGQVQLSKQPEDTNTSPDLIETNTSDVQPVLISKGQEVEVEISSDSLTLLKDLDKEELNRRLAWTDGFLVFKNQRLEEIVKELSRYTNDRVVIVDPEIGDLRVSGRFSMSDTNALLDAVEVSFNVAVTRNNKGIIYLSEGS